MNEKKFFNSNETSRHPEGGFENTFGQEFTTDHEFATGEEFTGGQEFATGEEFTGEQEFATGEGFTGGQEFATGEEFTGEQEFANGQEFSEEEFSGQENKFQRRNQMNNNFGQKIAILVITVGLSAWGGTQTVNAATNTDQATMHTDTSVTLATAHLTTPSDDVTPTSNVTPSDDGTTKSDVTHETVEGTMNDTTVLHTGDMLTDHMATESTATGTLTGSYTATPADDATLTHTLVENTAHIDTTVRESTEYRLITS